jgi:hypothetical protein
MAQAQASDWSKQWGQVVAKAWTDAQFKKRLLADPAAALKQQGLEVPRGLQVKVVENTDQVFHFTLPAKPSGEMSEKDLEKVAGGMYDAFLKFDFQKLYPAVLK